MAPKKASTKGSAKKTTAKRANAAQGSSPKSMPAAGRDPKGGLTAKGREYFNKKEGSHLRPGVQGPADTPEKMVRKGSFLRRHFTHPRGPMKDDKGEPTRLALSAHAWGEAVPQNLGDAKKLADEGHQLLEQYHEVKDAEQGQGKLTRAGTGGKSSTKTTAKKATVSKKAATKKAATKKTAARKTAVKKAAAKKAKR